MFRLALALGMTVKRLLREIDGDELTHWIAYDAVTPIGEKHSDFLAAYICQTIANRTGGKGENSPYKLSEFLLDFWKESEVAVAETGPSPQELWNKIQHIHAMATAHHQAKLIRETQQNGGR